MVCFLGNTARAALFASELCKLCGVHLKILNVHQLHLSIYLNDLRTPLSHLLGDLCLDLLHRQLWLNWDHSCGQRRHNLINYFSGQLVCCSGGERLAYAGIRSCHRVDIGRPICPGVGAVAYSV